MEKKAFGIYKNRRLRTTGPAGISPTSFYNLKIEEDIFHQLNEWCSFINEDLNDWIVKKILIGLYRVKNDCQPDVGPFQKLPAGFFDKEPEMPVYKYMNFSINGAILHQVKDMCTAHGMKKIDPWVVNQIKIGLREK
jgi:hypothetical protein